MRYEKKRMRKKIILYVIEGFASILVLSVLLYFFIPAINDSVNSLFNEETTSTPTNTTTYSTTTTAAPTTEPITTTEPTTTEEVPTSTEVPKPEPIMYTVEKPPLGRSEEIQKKITPKTSESLGVEYFDDCLFVGDSITMGFSIWKNSIKIDGVPLWNSSVFAARNYGVYNALKEVSDTSIHPPYEGNQIRPEDAVSVYNSKRVFIQLGMNDLWLSKENFIYYYNQLLKNITDKNPDVEIVILSISPYLKEGLPSPGWNEKILEYNNALIEFAYDSGIPFIDIAAAIRDEEGYLQQIYCSDGICHWTFPTAYEAALKYILEHPPLTAEQKSQDYEIIIEE